MAIASFFYIIPLPYTTLKSRKNGIEMPPSARYITDMFETKVVYTISPDVDTQTVWMILYPVDNNLQAAVITVYLGDDVSRRGFRTRVIMTYDDLTNTVAITPKFLYGYISEECGLWIAALPSDDGGEDEGPAALADLPKHPFLEKNHLKVLAESVTPGHYDLEWYGPEIGCAQEELVRLINERGIIGVGP